MGQSSGERHTFVYRGVRVYWQPQAVMRWSAEIPRDRAFEFARAETAAALLRKIDALLGRSSHA